MTHEDLNAIRHSEHTASMKEARKQVALRMTFGRAAHHHVISAAPVTSATPRAGTAQQQFAF